jgi:hypothetical protein
MRRVVFRIFKMKNHLSVYEVFDFISLDIYLKRDP